MLNRDVDQDEYNKLTLEVFNEDSDVDSAINQFIFGGYSDAEFLERMVYLRLQASKEVDKYLEDMKNMRESDLAFDEEHA